MRADVTAALVEAHRDVEPSVAHGAPPHEGRSFSRVARGASVRRHAGSGQEECREALGGKDHASLRVRHCDAVRPAGESRAEAGRATLNGPTGDYTRKYYQTIKRIDLCSSAGLYLEGVRHFRPDPSSVQQQIGSTVDQ
jgi:hypothetical protein